MLVLCAFDERLCKSLSCDVKICVLEIGECTKQLSRLGSIFYDVNSSHRVTAGIQKCPIGCVEEFVKSQQEKKAEDDLSRRKAEC